MLRTSVRFTVPRLALQCECQMDGICALLGRVSGDGEDEQSYLGLAKGLGTFLIPIGYSEREIDDFI